MEHGQIIFKVKYKKGALLGHPGGLAVASQYINYEL